jgi:predicted ATPase
VGDYDPLVLHGRGHECAAIDDLLENARRSRSGGLVIRGESGIGKTALLGYAIERASAMHVLSAIGIPSESGLPFASLHQLLRPVLDHLGAIPEPQATALRGALGLSPIQGANPFFVALGLLSLCSELSEQRPVLCAVDDAQWLDPESMDALLFVARRVDAEGID